MQFSDFSETWQKDDSKISELQIDGYMQHLINFGQEKGIAVHYKEEKFQEPGVVTLPSLQVSHVSSIDLDVIAVYRSSNCPDALGSSKSS